MEPGTRRFFLRVLMPALVLAGLSPACGGEGDGGGGVAAICRVLNDGDSYRLEFLDAGVAAGYAAQTDDEGLVRVRLLGTDYPDISGPDDLADCNDPGTADYDGMKCEAWRDAWEAAYGTPVLDLDRIDACYEEGLELLSDMLLDRKVMLTTDEGEVYPWGTNLLAYVSVGGTDVSTWLVEHGYAIAYDSTPQDLCEKCPALQEAQASLAQAGGGCLWGKP